MQSYIQPIQYCSFNDALTSYIINKCVNFSSYEINKDNVKLLYKNQNNKYIIEITKEGKKPILINSDINLDNKN
jgi:hypothetical protein